MPYFLHVFALKLNCRTASKGQGIRDPLRSHSNKKGSLGNYPLGIRGYLTKNFKKVN